MAVPSPQVSYLYLVLQWKRLPLMVIDTPP